MSPKALALSICGFVAFMFLLFFVIIPWLDNGGNTVVIQSTGADVTAMNPIWNDDPDDKDPCVPDPNSEACKAKKCGPPRGCFCRDDGVWINGDGQPAMMNGQLIYCEEVK